jgi:hypothetical protein
VRAHKINSKATTIAAVLFCCLAGVASGAYFYWTGNSKTCTESPYVCGWTDEDNWNVIGVCGDPCVPSTVDDDAAIAQPLYSITLGETLTIDDLNISITGETPTVAFLASGGAQTVTCDTITISSGVVSVTALAGLLAAGSEPCES